MGLKKIVRDNGWQWVVHNRGPAKIVVEVKVENIIVVSNPTVINANGAAIGNLNTGEQTNFGTIEAQVHLLAENGQQDLADSLKSLTEAVMSDPSDLLPEARKEALEWLAFLAEQGNLDNTDRKSSVVRSALDSLAEIFSAAGGLATVWQQWGPSLVKFFGC